jgi:hypothetical protein
MPITVEEPASYDSYSERVDEFQLRMKQTKNTFHETFSEEREKGKSDVRRFIARNDRGLVVGWMTLKTQDADLKIEGICTDPLKENSKGAAKALVTHAVNCSFAAGKGGVLTLTNASQGTGDKFYEYMGFRYTEEGGSKMRLEINHREWDTTKVGTIESKHGKTLDVVEHLRKA